MEHQQEQESFTAVWLQLYVMSQIYIHLRSDAWFGSYAALIAMPLIKDGTRTLQMPESRHFYEFYYVDIKPINKYNTTLGIWTLTRIILEMYCMLLFSMKSKVQLMIAFVISPTFSEDNYSTLVLSDFELTGHLLRKKTIHLKTNFYACRVILQVNLFVQPQSISLTFIY